MRWFHWTVEQFMEVYNPPNAEVASTALSLFLTMLHSHRKQQLATKLSRLQPKLLLTQSLCKSSTRLTVVMVSAK